MTVYSERFLVITGNSVLGQFVVPAGKRVVLRDLLMSTTAAGGGAQLVVAGANAMVYNFPAGSGAVALDIRVVAYQLEVVKLATYGSAMYAALSGYLFADPSGQHGPPVSVSYRRVSDTKPAEAE